MSDQESTNTSQETNILCYRCKKEIDFLHTAIASVHNGAPMHFDCVLEEIASEETLEADDKVVYLGAGSFGVVNVRPAGSPIPFIVKKRIQYENKEEKPAWRNDIVRSLVREELN